MTDFAREYGEGLYELCVEEGITAEVLPQLTLLQGVFQQEPDFLRLLSNRAVGISERLSLLDNVLKGRIAPYLLNFCKLLCERGLMFEFAGCVAVYTDHYNQDNHISVAKVTTPVPLTEDQRDRLIEKLKTMTGREIFLQEKTDASLMGGVLLEMDGKRWDNTVKSRLDTLRRMLTDH